jgi:hypothetical protein
MSDWEIIRIKDDVAASDTERWTIVYQVPVEYAPDGVFSLSIPKATLNVHAAAYEYDIDNPAQVDALFDHVMTRPMLTASVIGEPAASGMASLMRSKSSMADVLRKTRDGFRGREVYLRDPAELRADIKAGIDAMKGGVARLKPAAQVELHRGGELVGMADMSENPKYIVMRDMVSRLQPENIAAGREFFRQQRQLLMAQAGRKSK